MGVWFRIFGSNNVQPEPAAILAHLRDLGVGVAGKFYDDENGWYQAELLFGDKEPTLQLQCFLAKEENIRADLNAWAAWLETVQNNPHHEWLMQHMISTTRVFTLHASDDWPMGASVEKACIELCKFLARETAGVYQVDGQGFFAADRALLLKEYGP
jgi:hypothetical protein